MERLHLQQIYIYPVKSLGGISVSMAEVQQTGLQYDRRWMLVDKEGRFLSQRTFPQMALLQVELAAEGLLIRHKRGILQPLLVPFQVETKTLLTVQIWDDVCTAAEVPGPAAEWFSEAMGMSTRLVYMPPSTRRQVDPDYAKNEEVVSFADAYPILLIGQASLDELNSRLVQPVPINRFRPNLVVQGGDPFCEDRFDAFQIGNVRFKTAKPCARCALITIDQENAAKGREPLQTLSTYRNSGNKVLFGQNLLQGNFGTIRTGDEVFVKSWKQSPHLNISRAR